MDQSKAIDTLGDLLAEVMDRRDYRSLSELSRHTSIPYQTLWAWKEGTRNLKRPPAPSVLRKLASDFGMPEAVVFRAAGRSYADPGSLDAESLELLHIFGSVDADCRRGLLRILHLYQSLAPAAREAAEKILRDLQVIPGPG